MEIIVAKEAGFCFGVKRAIDLAYKNIENNIFSLGPLIHNPQVVEDLNNKGLKKVNNISEIPDGETVLIRSHGVGPQIFLEAKQKNLKVINGTCPFVEKAQKIAKKLAEENYIVVIVGDKNHPEVQGISEWASSSRKTYVIADEIEAEKLPQMDKVGVLAQTTLPENNFNKVVKILKKKCDIIKVHNSICRATRARQEAAREIAPIVDTMVVIGGRNSANTGKLVKLCREMGTTTYHIEHADELQKSMFNNVKVVGVTAGASTPDWIIEEVVLKMVEFNEEKDVQQEEIEVKETPQEEAQEVAPEASEAQESVADEDQNQIMTEVSNFKKGDIITGTVVQIDDEQILVDIGGKSEGIIPKGEISLDGETPDLKPGDEIEVFVIKSENEEGNPILSKRRADRRRAWETVQNAFENDLEIKGKAVEVVKGGVLVDVGIRGFVPASLVERGYVENLEDYVGKDLRLKVIELDKNKNKVVLSQKKVLDEEYEAKKKETWENIEVGQVVHGIVRRLTDFGAFIDIGGVDGLLHVSEISWGRVEHPKDVLQENQEIDVVILGIDREAEKVSLGLKQLQENPWKSAGKNYPVGTVVKGKVLRIAPFGAFVEVEPGVEGLVHISQLAEEHVEKTEDVVAIGDEVEVKVLSVDTEAQRMSLSIKEAKPKKQAPPKKKEEKKEEYITSTNSSESGVTIGDLYGDLLKGNEK